MMKLCYIDITVSTDVNGLFASYRNTIAALERDYPKVRFIKATVPLTTEPGLLPKAKALVTGNDRFGPAENLQRERLNALIRHQYSGPELFDIAAVESTAPNGSRVSGTQNGQSYFALYNGYASDNGHLNAEGSRRAASAWLKVIARVSTR